MITDPGVNDEALGIIPPWAGQIDGILHILFTGEITIIEYEAVVLILRRIRCTYVTVYFFMDVAGADLAMTQIPFPAAEDEINGTFDQT